MENNKEKEITFDDVEIDFTGRPWVFQFSGLMHSGKDTCAALLKDILEEQGKKVLCLNYADFLKVICTRNYGYNDHEKEKGRKILQDFGTKVKNHERDFWIHTVFHFFDLMRYDYDAFIIADCRYEEELQPRPYIYTYPIVNIYVARQIDIDNNYLKHDSEKMALNFNEDQYHWILNNNGSVSDTKKQLVDMVNYFEPLRKQMYIQQLLNLGEYINEKHGNEE